MKYSAHFFRIFVLIYSIHVSVILNAEESIHPVTTDMPRIVDPATLTTNELVTIDRLIEVTQRSVDKQKALRELIKEYQAAQALSIKDPDDTEKLYSLAKMAYRVSQCIKDNHLDHAFDPEFLSELNLFAKVAAKQGIPPPTIK